MSDQFHKKVYFRNRGIIDEKCFDDLPHCTYYTPLSVYIVHSFRPEHLAQIIKEFFHQLRQI